MRQPLFAGRTDTTRKPRLLRPRWTMAAFSPAITRSSRTPTGEYARYANLGIPLALDDVDVAQDFRHSGHTCRDLDPRVRAKGNHPACLSGRHQLPVARLGDDQPLDLVRHDQDL